MANTSRINRLSLLSYSNPRSTRRTGNTTLYLDGVYNVRGFVESLRRNDVRATLVDKRLEVDSTSIRDQSLTLPQSRDWLLEFNETST